MQVGILGAGRMGQTLARLLVGAGHPVRLANARGPHTLSALVADLGPLAATSDSAGLLAWAEVVILATRWEQTASAVQNLGPWDGTIVVDTTNNRFGPGPQDVYDLGELTSSEVVAALLPGARLVKAFNHQPIPTLAEHLGGRSCDPVALFLAGDDPAARQIVAQLILTLGGTPMDLGPLRDGGRWFATGGGPLAGRGRLLTPAEARQILANAGYTGSESVP